MVAIFYLFSGVTILQMFFSRTATVHFVKETLPLGFQVLNFLLVCQLSSLPDKAEGNKFAKDFEDGSLKLQDFVGFLDKELKTGPPLLEALGNADIFYEMQYKEVKIVANVSVRS